MRWIISLFGAASLTVALALVMIQLIAVSDERGGRELVGYVPEPSSNDCPPHIPILDGQFTLPDTQVIFSSNIRSIIRVSNPEKISECGWRSGLAGTTPSSPYACPITLEVRPDSLQVRSDAPLCLSEAAQESLSWYLTCLMDGEAEPPQPMATVEGDVTIFHVIAPQIEHEPPQDFESMQEAC